MISASIYRVPCWTFLPYQLLGGYTSKQSNTLLFLEFQTRKELKKYTIERNSKQRYYIRVTRPDETRQGGNVVKITSDGIKKFILNGKNVKLLLFDV